MQVIAIFEHPFHIIKRLSGFTKVRYRGLTKNTGLSVRLVRLVRLSFRTGCGTVCSWNARNTGDYADAGQNGPIPSSQGASYAGEAVK
jgi:hypothetical protein